MNKNLFYVERTILLSTKKKFVIVGTTMLDNLNIGMHVINEIKGINQIIGSIEFVDTKEESYLGLVISYEDNDELHMLHSLEKGDYLILK